MMTRFAVWRPVLALVALWAVAASPQAHAQEVAEITSPGGIQAWLVEARDVPVVSLQFAFRGGTAHDPVGKEGLTTLAASLLTEGAGDLDANAFRQAAEDKGIRIGFSAGAEVLSGSLQTTTLHAETAYQLLAQTLTAPRFYPADLDRHRRAQLASIRGRVADPRWLSNRALYDQAFPDHPFARPSRGRPSSLAAITRDDLVALTERRFTRDTLVVAAAGDITPGQLGAVLDQVFGALPAGGGVDALPQATAPEAASTVVVERQGPQTTLLAAHGSISLDDPDLYAAIVLNHVLGGGGFSSRLTQALREDRGLTYGVFSSLGPDRTLPLWTVRSDMANEFVPEAVRVLRQLWADARQNGVTPAEVDAAKAFLTGSWPLRFTSTSRIAGQLLRLQVDGFPISHVTERNRRIEAVTLAEVNRVAAERLRPEGLTMVLVGAPELDGIAVDARRTAAEIAEAELAPPSE